MFYAYSSRVRLDKAYIMVEYILIEIVRVSCLELSLMVLK